ncbi:hypothetical protein AB0F15_40020 [Amycolatopsis sp. NPDC026612]|uniref:hypothetical protein n=1 Tax=Amycolatopsis sp. NPDC026612 TaxID=3155466 RepID=UPI0033E34B1B
MEWMMPTLSRWSGRGLLAVVLQDVVDDLAQPFGCEQSFLGVDGRDLLLAGDIRGATLMDRVGVQPLAEGLCGGLEVGVAGVD